MRNQTTRVFLTTVLCGVAGLAWTAPAAKDQTEPANSGGAVTFQTVVMGVRVVPDGNPLPGLHVDANVKGEKLDIYIAPMAFVTKYDVKVSKGQIARIEGTQTGDLVLAQNITTGVVDKRDGQFRPNMTIYLRNNEGPLW